MDSKRTEMLKNLNAAHEAAQENTAAKRKAYWVAFTAASQPAAARSAPDCDAELALVTAATILEQAELLEYQIAQSITMAAQMTYDECITGSGP